MLASAAFALTGCTLFLRDTPVPIPTQTTQFSPAGRSSTLVVFLPGRSETMDAFDRYGFIDALREAGVAADTLTVDAHLGYYYKRTVIDRLRAGNVWVNCYGAMHPSMPFGGFKESGLGREMGDEGFAALLETKSVYMSLS